MPALISTLMPFLRKSIKKALLCTFWALFALCKLKQLEGWWKPETRLMQGRIVTKLLAVTCHFQLNNWVLCFVIVWHSKPINWSSGRSLFSVGERQSWLVNVIARDTVDKLQSPVHAHYMYSSSNNFTCWPSQLDLEFPNMLNLVWGRSTSFKSSCFKHMLFPSWGYPVSMISLRQLSNVLTKLIMIVCGTTRGLAFQPKPHKS